MITRDEIYRRQIASLRWYYAGRLWPVADDGTPNHWVCCRHCGALYALPSELTESHRCPVAAAAELEPEESHQ